jgi:predicted GNAT family acetyltransferase
MSLEIHNDEKARKFYAVIDGQEAVIEYAKMDGTYNLAHTYVPEELRGQGIAEQLVQGTLEQIRREGAEFLPSCPYIQAFLKRHPEYQEGVPEAE